jgi:hypothetical protein
MFSDPKMRGGFYGPGHGLAGTEIIFPVGRRMAIVGAFEIKNEETRTLDEDGVAGVNGALFPSADNFRLAPTSSMSRLKSDAISKAGAAFFLSGFFSICCSN